VAHRPAWVFHEHELRPLAGKRLLETAGPIIADHTDIEFSLSHGFRLGTNLTLNYLLTARAPDGNHILFEIPS